MFCCVRWLVAPRSLPALPPTLATSLAGFAAVTTGPRAYRPSQHHRSLDIVGVGFFVDIAKVVNAGWIISISITITNVWGSGLIVRSVWDSGRAVGLSSEAVSWDVSVLR